MGWVESSHRHVREARSATERRPQTRLRSTPRGPCDDATGGKALTRNDGGLMAGPLIRQNATERLELLCGPTRPAEPQYACALALQSHPCQI
jgi:hypothetical protein